MSVVTMRKLLEAGAHYGHQTKRWNPNMKANIYGTNNGVHIIDLAKTQEYADTAYEAMKAIAEKGGKVLFVGTKKQAQVRVAEEAIRSGSFYVNIRWLGGILTNYRTIKRRISRLIEIEQMEATGTINNYTKKEIAQIRKEADKLNNFLGGIKEMKRLPNAVFIVDPTEDHIAVLEAHKLGIPVFGICDTNCDPAILDYGIPGNDDGTKSIDLFVKLMADAIVEANAGVLEVAHVADEEPEVSMADVMQVVHQKSEEAEKARRAKLEEQRKQAEKQRAHRFVNRKPRAEKAAEENQEATETVEEVAVDAAPVEE